MVYRYPPEVHELVKAWCTKLRDAELAAKCNEDLGTNFTAGSMKAFRGNHGYRNYLPKRYAGEEYWKHQTKWPRGMFEYIRDNSWGVSSAKMAEQVNERFGTSWTPSGIKQFRQRHGIRSGETGWYQKGHAPGTKGKTIEEICKNDPKKLARVRATQFKKGSVPANYKPVGTISVNKHGFLIRKRQDKGTLWERWEFLHRAVWEEYNGKIPEDMVVTFKDGDPSHCEIGNLMLVTRAECAQLRRYRSGHHEVPETALAMIRLKNAAQKIRKGGQT